MSTIDVFELDRGQFIAELSQRTTPQQLYNHAPVIYTYLARLFEQPCMDSVLREWAFQWSTDELGLDYDNIYQWWLSGFTL